MNKQELIKYLESEYKLVEKAKGADTWHGGCEFILRLVMDKIEQLDEPTSEPCELKEFSKPRYPSDKKLKKYYGCSACEYDLGSLPCDTSYCPACGRKITGEDKPK